MYFQEVYTIGSHSAASSVEPSGKFFSSKLKLGSNTHPRLKLTLFSMKNQARQSNLAINYNTPTCHEKRCLISLLLFLRCSLPPWLHTWWIIFKSKVSTLLFSQNWPQIWVIISLLLKDIKFRLRQHHRHPVKW